MLSVMVSKLRWTATLCLAVAAPVTVVLGKTAAETKPTALKLQFGSAEKPATQLVLRGADARQQLLASGLLADGAERDLTRTVAWTVTPEGVAKIDDTGRITPVADGHAVISARSAEGLSASVEVTVRDL